MKGLLFFISISLVTVATHKFYVSVTSVNLNSKKNQIEISSRIFIDDLNKALEKNNDKVFYIGSTRETAEEVSFLKTYILENIKCKVNNKKVVIEYLGKEIEDDVLIVYLVIRNIKKVNALEIENTLLFNYLKEQQHIIHTEINAVKKSILLDSSKKTDVIQYP